MDDENDKAIRQPTSYELAILRGLQGRSMYQGTVPDGVRQQRRARNRIARQSRQMNRGNR